MPVLAFILVWMRRTPLILINRKREKPDRIRSQFAYSGQHDCHLATLALRGISQSAALMRIK
jgi:hypothetical protein